MGTLDELLASVVATGVPGAAAVAVGPGGRIERAAGIADLAAGEPLSSEHRFRIGSVTKIFVAALVLRLVDEGLLDLDGSAAPFVEDVTIRELLDHTSGLDDFVVVFAPLGLERSDLEEPLRDDCAHGYLPADNPILPAATAWST